MTNYTGDYWEKGSETRFGVIYVRRQLDGRYLVTWDSMESKRHPHIVDEYELQNAIADGIWYSALPSAVRLPEGL